MLWSNDINDLTIKVTPPTPGNSEPFGFSYCTQRREPYINTCMRLSEILQDNIGPAPTKVCKSGKPDSELPASWLASCKSKGLRRRDSDREHKLDGKRKTVGHKTVKGAKYGGPLPDYSK